MYRATKVYNLQFLYNGVKPSALIELLLKITCRNQNLFPECVRVCVCLSVFFCLCLCDCLYRVNLTCVCIVICRQTQVEAKRVYGVYSV
jgi:hypothetical protein